jgi:hypothetical protein
LLEERIANARTMPSVSELFREIRARIAAKDPEIPDNVSYKKVKGELVGATGPQLSDIDQGRLGDCYFLAAVGSMVANDPSSIRDLIRDNGDGTYSVQFYAGVGGMRVPVSVMVDGDLPVDAAGNLVYARGADTDGDGRMELWVPILEKAYAKFQDLYGPADGVNGYVDIGGGGWPDDVLEDLTGRPAYRTSSYASDAKLSALLEAANEGSHVAIATNVDDVDAGWVANHAYTVIGTYEQDGVTMVTLRNPWGATEPGDDGVDDGIFDVPLDELRDKLRSVQTDEPRQPRIEEILRRAFSLVA